MNDLPPQPSASVIAIDGGGTRCRLALTTGAAPVVVEVGPVNVTSDFNAALHELTHGLQALAVKVGVHLTELVDLPTYAGLAGVMDRDMAHKVAAALPQRHIRVEDDRHAALRGALGAKDGVMIHCGTGSFVAAQVAGKPRFAGGWGAVLGDSASAQWVGRRALTLTLDVVDDLHPPTALSDHMLAEFSDAAGIVAFATNARPADFGALAPVVTKLASDGDTLAIRIMTEAAQSIATLLPKLGWTPGMALCLTGGIGPFYAPYLSQDITADLTAPLGEPLSGAIALAQHYRAELMKTAP